MNIRAPLLAALYLIVFPAWSGAQERRFDSRSILDDDEDEPVGTLTMSGSLGVQYSPSTRSAVGVILYVGS